MHLQSRAQLLAKRLTVVLTLLVMFGPGSINTAAQSFNRDSVSASTANSEAADRDANAVVFETDAISVRRITIKPNSTGYHYRHPGGSIILLSEYSFKLPIPLSGELDAKLKVGDVIPVEAGDYVLENPTSKFLDFLSIEKKK